LLKLALITECYSSKCFLLLLPYVTDLDLLNSQDEDGFTVPMIAIKSDKSDQLEAMLNLNSEWTDSILKQV
jgi:hypothetical protein